jgi:membrane protease YdiL (CAAX protease family)
VHAIGVAGALYVIYAVLLIPALAFRGARMVTARGGAPARRALPSRATIYLNTIVIQLFSFTLAWLTARTFGYRLFALPRLCTRELFAGAAALLFQFAMMYVSHASRSLQEIGKMPVDKLMPRSPGERALFAVTSVVAGVSEEAAYRGVLMTIVWYATGSAWLAVLVSALAFSLGHALQGWKSMTVIFIMACSMHALVWYTGTLVIAMGVHAIYDLLVPTLRRRISPALPTDRERIAG